MENLKFACTALNGTNKGGVLKPDENGYYKLILGAFNIYNSAGLWYDYETSKAVFDASSSFTRRMESGNLYSEEDHPQWDESKPLDAYVQRIKRIDPKNVCAHIRDVHLVPGEMNADGTKMMLIYGSVKPDRERGPILKAALDNPDQNVCFSLRSLCEDKYINGRYVRTLTELITFDWVIEPGLHVAHKYNAPGLESWSCSDLEETIIPLSVIGSVLAGRDQVQGKGIGMESSDYDDLQRIYDSRMAKRTDSINKPSALSWCKK